MKKKTPKRQRDLPVVEKEAIIKQLKWSQPMGLKKLAVMYGVHPNTMRNWLKNQNVKNQQMSPRSRYWRIAIEDLPADLVINALVGASLPEA